MGSRSAGQRDAMQRRTPMLTLARPRPRLLGGARGGRPIGAQRACPVCRLRRREAACQRWSLVA
eukprot:12609655-Heterocapsa_arctica.AAC.1